MSRGTGGKLQGKVLDNLKKSKKSLDKVKKIWYNKTIEKRKPLLKVQKKVNKRLDKANRMWYNKDVKGDRNPSDK